MSILKRNAGAPYELGNVQVQPITPAIGAELSGVDLSEPMSEDIFLSIKRALLEHEVIFFRGQNLDDEQHMRLAKRFGKPAYSKKLPMHGGREDMSLLDNDGTRNAVGAGWHTDNTDYEQPPLGSLLYAQQVPQVGGDTMWCSMTAAYDALSPQMQAYLCSLHALHDNSNVQRTYAGKGTLRSEGTAVDPPVRHPVVRMHPETGRSVLFVNSGYSQRILGVPDIESRHILAMLHEHVMRPEFQVRFRWSNGALAIWDNRSTQHYALDDYVETRRMRRVQIVGDKPRPANPSTT